MAAEIMLPTAGIRANVRDDKLHQIYSAIQTGGKDGMQTMNMALFELVQQNIVSRDIAYERSTKPDDLDNMFADAGIKGARKR